MGSGACSEVLAKQPRAQCKVSQSHVSTDGMISPHKLTSSYIMTRGVFVCSVSGESRCFYAAVVVNTKTKLSIKRQDFVPLQLQ